MAFLLLTTTRRCPLMIPPSLPSRRMTGIRRPQLTSPPPHQQNTSPKPKSESLADEIVRRLMDIMSRPPETAHRRANLANHTSPLPRQHRIEHQTPEEESIADEVVRRIIDFFCRPSERVKTVVGYGGVLVGCASYYEAVKARRVQMANDEAAVKNSANCTAAGTQSDQLKPAAGSTATEKELAMTATQKESGSTGTQKESGSTGTKKKVGWWVSATTAGDRRSGSTVTKNHHGSAGNEREGNASAEGKTSATTARGDGRSGSAEPNGEERASSKKEGKTSAFAARRDQRRLVSAAATKQTGEGKTSAARGVQSSLVSSVTAQNEDESKEQTTRYPYLMGLLLIGTLVVIGVGKKGT